MHLKEGSLGFAFQLISTNPSCPFQFEAACLTHESFDAVFKGAWMQHPFSLHEAIQAVTQALAYVFHPLMPE